VGDGRKAKFWTSAWLQGQVAASLFPTLYKHSRRNNIMVSEALAENKWMRDVDYSMTQQIIAEFIELWERCMISIYRKTGRTR
jgi:hypothetical protein